jgi:hypothetical protein
MHKQAAPQRKLTLCAALGAEFIVFLKFMSALVAEIRQ